MLFDIIKIWIILQVSKSPLDIKSCHSTNTLLFYNEYFNYDITFYLCYIDNLELSFLFITDLYHEILFIFYFFF